MNDSKKILSDVLSVNIMNSYGIKELIFDFDMSKINLIYSRNGNGKTSLAKSLFDLKKKGNKNTNKNKITKEKIKLSCSTQIHDFILFGKPDKGNVKDYNFGVDIFNVNSNLELDLEKFEKDLNEIKKHDVVKLFNSSKNYDFNLEDLIDILNIDSKLIEKIESSLSINEKDYKYIIANYSDIFSSTFEKLVNEDVYKKIIEYNHKYNEFVKKKTIFFDGASLKTMYDFMETIKNSNIFDNYNLISKKDNTTFVDFDSYKSIVELELNKLQLEISTYREKYGLNDIFKDKKLNFIENNIYFTNHILTFNDYLNLKKYVQNRELKKIKLILDEMSSSLKIYKDIYSKNTINFEKEWKKIDLEYKSIFKNSIKVELEKEKGEILSQAVFKAKFKLTNKNNDINIDDKNIDDTLSEAEKRCLYIFDILFKIEKIKTHENKDNIVLLFDDIIDSFDLKNKHGIIYYLKKIENSGLKALILTHDFSFFKLLNTKLFKKNSYIMNSNKGIIYLNPYKDFKSFKDYLIDKYKETNDIKYILGLIPVTREHSENSTNVNLFTHCLHIKRYKQPYTNQIKLTDIIQKLNITTVIQSNPKDQIYLESLYSVCDSITYDKVYATNHLLEEHLDKTCLAIGIRLILETKIIDWVNTNYPNNVDDIIKIKRNQTKHLLILYNKLINFKSELVFYEILSSDLIHSSGLNYEATFGYSLNYFKNAYESIKTLDLK